MLLSSGKGGFSRNRAKFGAGIGGSISSKNLSEDDDERAPFTSEKCRSGGIGRRDGLKNH